MFEKVSLNLNAGSQWDGIIFDAIDPIRVVSPPFRPGLAKFQTKKGLARPGEISNRNGPAFNLKTTRPRMSNNRLRTSETKTARPEEI